VLVVLKGPGGVDDSDIYLVTHYLYRLIYSFHYHVTVSGSDRLKEQLFEYRSSQAITYIHVQKPSKS
jgi:hypothetical protein